MALGVQGVRSEQKPLFLLWFRASKGVDMSKTIGFVMVLGVQGSGSGNDLKTIQAGFGAIWRDSAGFDRRADGRILCICSPSDYLHCINFMLHYVAFDVDYCCIFFAFDAPFCGPGLSTSEGR